MKNQIIIKSDLSIEEIAEAWAKHGGEIVTLPSPKYFIGTKESEGKPMQFFKGIDPRDDYLLEDYGLCDAKLFCSKREAIDMAKHLEENYGPHTVYVLTIEPLPAKE